MVSNSFYPNAVLLGTIITGTLNTMVYKYQNQQPTDYGPFVHPYMQVNNFINQRHSVCF